MILLLASATGSPGVTTTAIGLTLYWPGPALLVDADRQPSQAIAAGWLGGTTPIDRGLAGLATLHRERRSISDELMQYSVPLLVGAEPKRTFLPGFTHPASAQLFGPVWGELAHALRRVERSGTDVLIDCGRLGEGLPAPLLAEADGVLVLTRTSLRALAAVRLYLPGLLQRQEQLTHRQRVGLGLIGPGQPYSAREISAELGVPAWAELPDDPKHAQIWSDGAPSGRRFNSSALVTSVRAAAQGLGVLLAKEPAQ